jgi:hypothetical protein
MWVISKNDESRARKGISELCPRQDRLVEKKINFSF